jgi:hypothetical protein
MSQGEQADAVAFGVVVLAVFGLLAVPFIFGLSGTESFAETGLAFRGKGRDTPRDGFKR